MGDITVVDRGEIFEFRGRLYRATWRPAKAHQEQVILHICAADGVAMPGKAVRQPKQTLTALGVQIADIRTAARITPRV